MVVATLDPEVYRLISAVAVAALGAIGVIAAKRLPARSTRSSGKRADFESMIEGAATMLDLKDKEMARQAAVHREEVEDLKATLERCRLREHDKNNQLNKANMLVQSYILRFGDIEQEIIGKPPKPQRANENGDPR